MHTIPPNFFQVRQRLYKTHHAIEIIYVVDESIVSQLFTENMFETIITKKNKGRGYMLCEGLQIAKGDVVVFLHADTLLPLKWDEKIFDVMQDKKVIGGAFSLTFDTPSFYLKIGVKFVTLLSRFTGVLSGDRALFIRREPLLQEDTVLAVPIFEDVELSYWMHHKGTVSILSDKVITSARAFKQHGLLRHTWRIIMASFRYVVGDDLQSIFRYYYH